MLITGAGARGVPGLIKDLRSSGEPFHIVTADIDGEAVGNLFADNSYVVSPWDDEDYIPSLLDVVEKEGIGYLIPNDGPAGLVKLSRLAAAASTPRIAVSVDTAELETALNKHALYERLKATGLDAHVPRFVLARTSEELLDAVEELGYPQSRVAVKPAVSEGSRGFMVIDGRRVDIFDDRSLHRRLTLEELRLRLEGLATVPDVLAMEYLPGDEYSVDVLVDEERRPRYMVPRLRERVAEGISVKGVVVKNREVETLAAEVLDRLGLIYALNIQIRYSHDGVPKVIEVNPRVSGTMTSCTGAGVNMHYFLVLLLAGRPLPAVQVRYNTRMYRYYSEKYLHGQ